MNESPIRYRARHRPSRRCARQVERRSFRALPRSIVNRRRGRAHRVVLGRSSQLGKRNVSAHLRLFDEAARSERIRATARRPLFANSLRFLGDDARRFGAEVSSLPRALRRLHRGRIVGQTQQQRDIGKPIHPVAPQLPRIHASARAKTRKIHAK